MYELTADERAFFHHDGYVLIDAAIPVDQATTLRCAVQELLDTPSPMRVVEKDGKTARSLYGTHEKDERFRALVRNPTLVRAARALLGGEVYVYQFKVNLKEAFAGDVWEWHQDYIFWEREDGLPRPDILTCAVFLDDVNEFNGPITLVPQTQRLGTVDAQTPELPVTRDRRQPYEKEPEWIANLVAKLKYSVDNETLKGLVDRWGMVAPKGRTGSALLFHSKTIHGSAPNISPYSRRVALVTYCRSDNFPPPPGSKRPEFLCARDHSPLTAIDEE